MHDAARLLAKYGRHGDNNLVHVSDKELRGIEQLTGKKFTRNPETGLPEAFNFGKLLATAAPIAAGIGVTALTGNPVLGAAASGAVSGGSALAQGKSSEQALTQGLISGITSYAGGQIMAGVGDTAGQAAAEGAAQGAGQGAGQGLNVASAGYQGAEAVPMAAGYQGAIGPAGVTELPAGVNPAAITGSPTSTPDQVATAALNRQAATQAQAPAQSVGFGQRLSNIASNPEASFSKLSENVEKNKMSALIAGAGAFSTAADMIGQSGGIPGQAPYDPLRYPEQFPANPRTWNAPPAGYRPGYDPEYRYFAGGGYVPPEPKKDKDSGGIPDFLSMGVMGAVPAAMGMDRDSITQFAPMNIMRNLVQSPDGELGEERERYRALYQAYMANPANQQAASMASGQPMGMAKGGLASMRPEGSYTANLMNEAKAALLGEHPRPSDAISKFRETFGDEALALLKDRVTGGRVRGAGGGMDDLVPGTIEGRQKVRLADGEFVVPADVVSGLGDGSTDQGVRKLHGLMRDVRKERTGKTSQPKAMGGKISL